MKITEVRIFPTESKDGKLKAFATMTFDDWFVVRNVKVILGNNGLFVAMPSRKAMIYCPKCRFKNVVGSKFCNQCGAEIGHQEVIKDSADEKQGSHMDIAHPITQECRVYIQEKILEAFNKHQGNKKIDRAPHSAPRGDDKGEAARRPEPEVKHPEPEIRHPEPEESHDSNDILL